MPFASNKEAETRSIDLALLKIQLLKLWPISKHQLCHGLFRQVIVTEIKKL